MHHSPCNQFWKQFFEASANISLSSYEEPTHEDDLTQHDTTATHDSTFQTPTVHEEDETITGANADDYDEGLEESLLDSPSNATGVHSTPKLPSTGKRTRVGGKAKLTSPPPSKSNTNRQIFRSREASEEPSTPRPQMAVELESSPFEPPSAYQVGTAQRQQNHDPLLHRILDKNYRIQATPHTTRKQQSAVTKATPATGTTTRQAIFDSSPMSSPEISAPQLRSDLFSPAPASTKRRPEPRTPGISVQTPGKAYTTSTGRALYTDNATRTLMFESESEDEDVVSPPKTMQFHVPQSRLMQTPAREASKMIVQDLLMTAGADATDEIEGVGEEEESPSIVRRKYDDDDTF